MAITTLKTQTGNVLPSTVKAQIKKRLWRESLWGYFFLAPMILLVLGFSIYPTFASIKYALYNWDGISEPTQFVGLRHIVTVATSPEFWNALKNTVIYTVFLVPIQLLLALALALVLNNQRLRFRNVYRAVFFLPSLMTPAVAAIVVSLLIARISSNFPQWMIDLKIVSPELGFINDPRLALPTVIVFGIWLSFGYNLVYFLAALQSVPGELYEAATIDGAGRAQRFFNVTIPMIRPVGVVIALLAVLGSLGVFDAVFVMTGGGPAGASDVVSTYIYNKAFGAASSGNSSNYGFASAAGLFYSLLLMGLTVLQIIILGGFRKRQAALSLT